MRKLITILKIGNQQRKSPTVNKIKDFYKECDSFSYKVDRKKWVTFYDVETAFKIVVGSENITDNAREVLIMVKIRIENMQRQMKSLEMPMKALKRLTKTAQKSIVE